MAQGLQYNTVVTATSATAGVAFGFNALKVVVVNDGTGSCYFDFTTTSGCTTGAHRLASAESISLSAKGQASYSGLSYVASTSGNATVRVLALR